MKHILEIMLWLTILLVWIRLSKDYLIKTLSRNYERKKSMSNYNQNLDLLVMSVVFLLVMSPFIYVFIKLYIV